MTYRRDRQGDHINKVYSQQQKQEETEYAGTFVRKNSKERYCSTRIYYPKPMIKTEGSSSEESIFDSEEDEWN